MGNSAFNPQSIASPLTTKGDMWGFSTANARVPVGADNYVWTADSTQALGVKYASPDARIEQSSYPGAVASQIQLVAMTAAGNANDKLLLHCNGADAATLFLDSGRGSHLVTAMGNAQIDTAQSKFGGASGLFDGTGDYLYITDNLADLNVGASFTIDMWAYLDEAMGTQRMLITRGGGFDGWNLTNGHHWVLFLHTDSKLYFQWNVGGGTGSIASTGTVSVNGAWHHFAIVNNAGTGTLYLDGTSVGSGAIGTISMPAGGVQALAVGATTAGSAAWKGWQDEVRINTAEAVWTTNFTPPVAAYTDSRAEGMYLVLPDGSTYRVNTTRIV